ncbi:hypothetical protein [Streptomyces sp. B6B3]|uniref:hypothetical protein n=1 Tax=Streptomyces sp. B6B3 TaxID=3153570 RepID=UPI00325EA6F4
MCAFAVAAGAVAGPASAAASTPAPPGFSFDACPTRAELPAGADPAAWRCEAMLATGRLTLGRLDEPIEAPMTLTFAEGTIDGEFGQVFGELTAEPLRIGHTPWSLTTRYGGFSDFESNDERRGELALTFDVSGLGLPPGCSIGTEAEPIRLVLRETEPTAVVSPDPLVVSFGVADERFAAPRTSGCGPLGRLLDAVLGLPAPAGTNALDLDAEVALRSYDEIPDPVS